MTNKKPTDSQPTEDADSGSADLAVWSRNGLTGAFDDFFSPLEELFEPFVKLAPGRRMSGLGDHRQPTLDVQDRGDHYSVTAELPGFTKDEVQVKADSSGLELRAEKTEEHRKGKEGEYQRSSRSYYQHLSFPDNILSEKIGGTMKNGILELKVPKRVSKLKDAARRVDLK